MEIFVPGEVALGKQIFVIQKREILDKHDFPPERLSLIGQSENFEFIV